MALGMLASCHRLVEIWPLMDHMPKAHVDLDLGFFNTSRTDIGDSYQSPHNRHEELQRIAMTGTVLREGVVVPMT